MPPPVDPTFNCTYAPPANQLTPRVLKAQPPDPIVQRVLQGLLPIPDLPPGASPDQLVFPYLKYLLKTKYRWKNGILQLPVAKPPAPLPPLEGIPTLDTSGINQLSTQSGTQTLNTAPQTLAPQFGSSASQPVSGAGASQTSSSISQRPSAKIIQVHAPYGTKTVEFEIVRQGAEGVLPDPTPKNTNENLIDLDVDIYAPISSPDCQTFLWVAVGRYTYALTQPYWPSDGYVGGSTPADNSSLDTNWYDTNQYDSGVG